MTTWLGVRQTPARLPRLTVAAALGEPTGTPPLLPANPHTAARTPGGFAHYAIFEVDSVDMVGKMDRDFMSADWSHMLQDFELHLGSERNMIDQHFS